MGSYQKYFCRLIFLLVVVLSIWFVFAAAYDVAPSSAEAGGIISLLTFNVSNTTVAPNYTNFTNVTIGLIGTASIGNITNVTISNGTTTTTYYNDSFTASPIVIILNHNFSTTTSVNWTVNFTLSSSTTWNVTVGANVTTIGNRTSDNISYSALPYTSSLTPVTETTDPTASASCSPSSVTTGASFPCSCSGTDSGATASGVSTSSGSSTSNSITSTSNTGQFTYTCSVTDNAGNSASSTATYTVEQTPSSATTTTTTWTTHTITEGIFEQGYTRELGVKNRIKVQIGAEDHFVGVVSISESQATIEISSDPVQVILGVGEDAKVDVTDDGFYDVYVLLNGITNNKADVTIQKIYEEVPEGGTGIETNGEIEGEPSAEEEGGISVWVWILIAIVIIAIVFWQTKTKKK